VKMEECRRGGVERRGRKKTRRKYRKKGKVEVSGHESKIRLGGGKESAESKVGEKGTRSQREKKGVSKNRERPVWKESRGLSKLQRRQDSGC